MIDEAVLDMAVRRFPYMLKQARETGVIDINERYMSAIQLEYWLILYKELKRVGYDRLASYGERRR